MKILKATFIFVNLLIMPFLVYSQKDEFFFTYRYLRYVHTTPKCNYQLSTCDFLNGASFTRGMAVHPEGYTVGLQEYRIRDKKAV
ncbi:MAG: hypothetical protein IPG55_15965 [Saprospiraceae bacterium]|nr:hypothetical protein [Candidatus Defluviibacterium haderslevense]